MKPEKAMWEAVRPLLAKLDPYRIESHIIAGIPDVTITSGWIELKYLAEWPKRVDTIVRCDHFTVQQRVWLTKRVMAGGNAWLLLKVGKHEWILFKGDVAARLLGNVQRHRLYANCVARWERKPCEEELLTWLMK